MIDANIPLSFRPAQFETPSEVQGRRLTLANLGQRQVLQDQAIRENEMQYRDMLDKQARARAVREVFMSEPDPAKALPKIYAIDPAAGQAFSDHLNKREKEIREQQQQEFDFGQKIQTAIGNELAGIVTEPDRAKWPTLYKSARARLTVNPVFSQTDAGKKLLSTIPTEMPSEEQLISQARQNPQTAQLIENVLKSQQEAAERRQYGGRTAKEQDELDYRKLNLEQQRQNAEATREATAEYRKGLKDQADERNRIARERLEKDKAKQGKKDQTARMDRLQREFDAFDGQEQKWHGIRQNLGNILAANNDSEIIWNNRVEVMTPTLRQKIQQDFDHATAETQRLYALKARKMEEMGKTPEGAAPPAQPQAKPPAKQGQTFTEAEVRSRARAAGRDENAAVAMARQRGLIK